MEIPIRRVEFAPAAEKDYLKFKSLNPDLADKIKALILDIRKHPFTGLGKPEPLKNKYQGYWSRRITSEHRLVYQVKGQVLFVLQCRYHYE